MNMKMKGIYLTPVEWQALEAIKTRTGLGVSELVRRAVDEYLEWDAGKLQEALDKNNHMTDTFTQEVG